MPTEPRPAVARDADGIRTYPVSEARKTMARHLLDERLTDREAIGYVANHPDARPSPSLAGDVGEVVGRLEKLFAKGAERARGMVANYNRILADARGKLPESDYPAALAELHRIIADYETEAKDFDQAAALILRLAGERDEALRKVKRLEHRIEVTRKMSLRDMKEALAGDLRALRNRVEMMEAPPVEIVLSEGDAP